MKQGAKKTTRRWVINNAKHLTWAVGVLLLLMTGCKKEDITGGVQPVSVSVEVHMDATHTALALSTADVNVKISNNTTGQSYTAVTDDKGVAAFNSVSPGSYVLSASKLMRAADYEALTGIPTNADVAFNASMDVHLTSSGLQQLTLEAGRIGDLVFKQIYYAGSDTKNGAMFRDQFIEIYNNSNQTIYADSLYVASTHANQATVARGAVSFDWSTSIGMDAGGKDASKDFVYMENLFMIPGSGKQHPIEPGKSIVIAATGLNHKAPFLDNSDGGGKEVVVLDPSLTVDLSQADFEVYLQDYLRDQGAPGADFTPFKTDIDNPNVPNMTVIRGTGKEWVMDATGREDFLIFRTPEPISSFPSFPDPDTKEVTIQTQKYIQIPASLVIDAVEIMTPTTDKRTPKRLPSSLDGGPTFVTSGQYSSESLIRKTLKTVDGRIILQDTNHSSDDFTTKKMADPSKSPASFTTN